MACSKQAGVRAYLDFIKRATGEDVTQNEWHAIRQLALDTEAGEENHPGKLSRRRANELESVAAGINLARRLRTDIGIAAGGRYETKFTAVTDEMMSGIRAESNTYGTVAAIQYLADNGVEKTLKDIREEKNQSKNAAALCDRCGGRWGEDLTCERCSDESGNPRPVEQPGPLGPGANKVTRTCSECGSDDVLVLADGDYECQDCGTIELGEAQVTPETTVPPAERANGPAPHSLKEMGHYEVYKLSAGEGPRSVGAFHELERRALPDLEELRSSYSQYPADALDQATLLMDKLVPAMREFERVASNPESPQEDLERLASLVSDAAEDANYHTFNSWFMERSRKDGIDIKHGTELRRKDERAFQRLIEEAEQQG